MFDNLIIFDMSHELVILKVMLDILDNDIACCGVGFLNLNL